MAASALREKSEEGRRLPRGSDFGLASARFIGLRIDNITLALCPAGNESWRMRCCIKQKSFVRKREISTEKIDETWNKSPSHIKLRNTMATGKNSLPHTAKRDPDVRQPKIGQPDAVTRRLCLGEHGGVGASAQGAFKSEIPAQGQQLSPARQNHPSRANSHRTWPQRRQSGGKKVSIQELHDVSGG